MNDLPKIVTSNGKIRFQDCDPFNHLNNGCYINYFMNHREDALLKDYDLDIYAIAKNTGKSWVSTTNQIAYLRPVYLMETITIESQLIKYTDSELLVEMRMYNVDKSQLKSIIWCGFTHFNLLKQQREMHTDEFMDLFERIINTVENDIFEERILQIKSEKRKALVSKV